MVLIRDKIKVAVRICPTKHTNLEISTRVVKDDILIKDKQFSFDYVFDIYSRQEQIFEKSIKPLIDSFLIGINTTVFAYGQTGSGKTYTMGTHLPENLREMYKTGIIPRVLEYIFGLDVVMQGDAECNIQFLELYNEEIKDLLCAKSGRSQIRMADGKNGVTVIGLTLKTVNSVEEAMATLSEGSSSRTTASTAMNAESSRSHSIFTILLTQSRFNENGQKESVTSKFNFVDLAGSERLQRTQAIGARAKEGININFGLLALGNVINALSESGNDPIGKMKRHIPYRDSKLTRLLEDSLGGSSKCLMIACICPSSINCSETLSTLNYAARVKNIENRLSINQKSTNSKEENVQKLHERIAELEKEVSRLKKGSKDSEFLNEVHHIFQQQNKLNETSYNHTMENIDSLCNVMTMENDFELMECLPEMNNASLSFEKMSLNHKIKTMKELSSERCLDNNPKETLLDHFLQFLDKSITSNSLKLHKVAVNNSAAHKQLSKVQIHELRWMYLLNFVSQRHILTNCLYRQIINQYRVLLSKTHKVMKASLSLMPCHINIVNEMMSEIKRQSQPIRSSFSKRKTPILLLKNIENKLDFLFPLKKDGNRVLNDITNENDTNTSYVKKHSETLPILQKMYVDEPIRNHKSIHTNENERNTSYVKKHSETLPILPKMNVEEPIRNYESIHTNGNERNTSYVKKHSETLPILQKMHLDEHNRNNEPIQKLMETFDRYNLKRKRSVKLSNQRINMIDEKRGYVQRNGLMIPVIKSPAEKSASKIIKRAHTVLDSIIKKDTVPYLPNYRKYNNTDTYLLKKPQKPINILENFRLRNLLRK